jgi:GTP-binding protein HflX
MTTLQKERAMLLGLSPQGLHEASKESILELKRLAETAGAEVVESSLQQRNNPDSRTYFGEGKVAGIKAKALELDCPLIIVDDELRPSQQRNLEEALELKVLDRTQLILDIFAQRAQTGEGKLQVELAQLSYLLPRLVGMGKALSRLGGGIGTRGPGESKLESDRRRLRDRIASMRLEIDGISRTRELHRKNRRSSRAYCVALAGYTNAGKSSLFNALTEGQVHVQDQLFATLDPTVRPIKTEKSGPVQLLLSDTVGFIRKLPHSLVAAFRATLEEITEADLILRLMDASSESCADQLATVDAVLEDILKRQGLAPLGERKTLLAFNKVDLLSPEALQELRKAWPDAVFVSAKSGEGLTGLVEQLQRLSQSGFKAQTYLLPPEKAGLLAKYFAGLSVQKQTWGPDGVLVEAILAAPLPELDPYILGKKP